jgi:hypothetical protein
MLQILLITFVVMITPRRWTDTWFPPAPAKLNFPKPPKPPKPPYTKLQRWSMGLGALAMTALWLVNFLNPKVSLLEWLVVGPFIAIPCVEAAYHAIKPVTVPSTTDSIPASVQPLTPAPE